METAGLIVNADKCKRDGICVAECPRRVIITTDDDLPLIDPRAASPCNACGHCVAVCPHGALSHSQVPIEASPVIDPDLTLDWNRAEQFLRSRRSIRAYRDRPVEREKMERLIMTARYAPTASNLQAVRWMVINDRGKLDRLSEMTINWMASHVEACPDDPAADYFRPLITAWEAGVDRILYNAPSLVVASAPADQANGLVDVTIALSYLELAAPALGLGACWAGLLQIPLRVSAEARQEIGLPENHTWHYPMMVGYPVRSYKRMPERKAPEIIWD